jgi:hypothetical protein
MQMAEKPRLFLLAGFALAAITAGAVALAPTGGSLCRMVWGSGPCAISAADATLARAAAAGFTGTASPAFTAWLIGGGQ